VKVKNAFTEFISAIDKIRNGTDATVTEEEKIDCQPDGRENKRRWIESQRIPDAKKVCGRITGEARARFQYTNHLDASKLLDSVNFAEYSKKFPDSILDLAVESYPFLIRTDFEQNSQCCMKDQTFETSMQRSLSFSSFVATTYRILLVKRPLCLG
jgi:hypothetical protein